MMALIRVMAHGCFLTACDACSFAGVLEEGNWHSGIQMVSSAYIKNPALSF